ncbi:MAG TPA: acyl-CoA dehydrogenase family protein [Acidimicrobiales bacterium]|nr:acyl-CoA dehydrogenase family protein [Acidimicrobiales bacterium]
MDFTYDAEQEALADVARQAMDREVGSALVRRMADDPDGVDAALWQKLVDLGWTGLVIPVGSGGAGAGLAELCIVLHETGRVPLPGPFFSSGVLATLAARALEADELLADLAAGRTRGTVALHESGHGDPLDTVRTRARRRGAGWVLDGLKPLVLDGHTADWAIVVAGTEQGRRAFLVEKPDGEPVPALDPLRKVARLDLHDRPCVPIGPAGNQAPIWRRIVDDTSVALAAETLGVADRALELAIGYTKERVVFDRPVASFQVVKHKIVDMFHQVEMARVAVQFAAWASDAEDPARQRAAAMAAGYTTEAAVKVTGEDIQLHGGVGFTWANDAHFLFKRAKQNDVLLGGHATHRKRLAAMLVDTA